MAKFKVGDKVRFTDKCGKTWWFGPHTSLKEGVIVEKDPTWPTHYKYAIKCDEGERGGVDDEHIELIEGIAQAEVAQAKFKVGDRVVHALYGAGVVAVVDDVETTLPYRVDFSDTFYQWVTRDSLTPENTTKTMETPKATSERKFKVGDRVTLHGHPYSPTLIHESGVIVKESLGKRGDWDVAVTYNDGEGTTLSFKEFELRLATNKQLAIVSLIENGQPKPSSKPFVHETIEDAIKEAERLAGKHPGQKFGVYQLVTARIGTVSVVEA